MLGCMYEKEYDGKKFGKRVAEKVEQCGGYRNSAKLSGIPYSVLFAIARGREPKTEYFLRALRWLTGRKLKY
jgi:predicted transcriptional regulator